MQKVGRATIHHYVKRVTQSNNAFVPPTLDGVYVFVRSYDNHARFSRTKRDKNRNTIHQEAPEIRARTDFWINFCLSFFHAPIQNASENQTFHLLFCPDWKILPVVSARDFFLSRGQWIWAGISNTQIRNLTGRVTETLLVIPWLYFLYLIDFPAHSSTTMH